MAMRLIVGIIGVLILAKSLSSQEKPLTLNETTTYRSDLTFIAPSPEGVVLTCKVAPSEGDIYSDVFDCRLTEGHTLDGLVRLWLKMQHQEHLAMEAERQDNLKFLNKMQ